ncbi:MAG: hypothetical protein JNL71_07650 [Rhodospirillales bacterium]|nr:hypothetical protein [Rhodospirillales bacterium]
MTVYTRRLSDKIILAFDQACETNALDCAELLLKALEMSLTTMGGPGAVDRRVNMEPYVHAFERLQALKSGR